MSRYAEPDQAEAAFYQAFELCDLHAMQRVWEAGDTSSCIHPGGPLLQGHEAVLQSWEQIFSQARPPQLSYRVLQRLQVDGLAVHTVEEAIRPGDGPEAPTLLIATNLYRQGSDGWLMIAHHACLPMLGQRQASPQPVH